MGIRKELQPVKDDNGKVHLAKVCFSMKPEEKKLFCTVLKNAKLPEGCVSNISRCVEVDEMKISGYKSHDAHFIMHYLLQVVVRKVLPKKVSIALIRLENFFRVIRGKVIKRTDLDKMQSEINEIIFGCLINNSCFFECFANNVCSWDKKPLRNRERVKVPLVGRMIEVSRRASMILTHALMGFGKDPSM